MEELKVGIEKIGLYIPNNYVDLIKLANKRGIDPNKWTYGIGQSKMAVLSEYEDVISMGANAANKILNEEDKSSIGQVIFATESGIDFSKACSTYIHSLLDINKYAKSYEIKQACYGATAGLQIACDYVRLRPNEKVLIISSDIAKYGANTSGEVTQGAGAIAILVSSNPKILEIGTQSVSMTTDTYDFWRPSYSEVPMVDGKFSKDIYIDVFNDLMYEFEAKYHNSNELKAMVCHLPFTKMGKKALQAYKDNVESNSQNLVDTWLNRYESSTLLCRQIGNLYTGSLYLALISQLLYGDLQENDTIGLYSYGSGAVGEIFTGKLVKGFKDCLDITIIEKKLKDRQEIDVEDYDNFYFKKIYTEEKNAKFEPNENFKGFYLKELADGKRVYDFKN